MDRDKEVMRAEQVNAVNWDEALEKESWVAPLTDIFETDNEFFLTANLPGVSRENMRIKLEDNNLVIMGKIDYDGAVKRNYILNETPIGNYYRKFKISDSIDYTKIEARLENGQLFLKLPKHERIKPKTIEIR
ncbi:MAG TPA: Hsp20/alpha crystallin family protein [Ignavibacteriales bacterium]|nr:Hsp20/alpha crystallin family protein [Ignavibacteriales bacterium]HEX3072589.1 Hsp20/alpha crystallin family protein [Ignavibacteriales bacterium]